MDQHLVHATRPDWARRAAASGEPEIVLVRTQRRATPEPVVSPPVSADPLSPTRRAGPVPGHPAPTALPDNRRYGVPDREVNWAPLLTGSLQAGLLLIAVELLASLAIAYQRGVGVVVNLWKGVLPTLRFDTDQETFRQITVWGSTTAAVVLVVFSLEAFLRGRSFQVRAGRAFGWLDIAMMGFVGILRTSFLSESPLPTSWLWSAIAVGVAGFTVVSGILSTSETRRQRAVGAFYDHERQRFS